MQLVDLVKETLCTVPEDEGSDRFVLTRNQIRAGRVLTGLGIRELAAAAGISPTALSQIETGRTEHAHATTLRALRTTLEGLGVEFGPEGWIRRRDDVESSQPAEQERTLQRSIGRNIRTARQSLGMTCDEVAQSLGEDLDAYLRIERGSVQTSISTLIGLASILDTTTDQLIGAAPKGVPPWLEELPLDPAQSQQFAHLLGVASPSMIRMVFVILKEMARLREHTD